MFDLAPQETSHLIGWKDVIDAVIGGIIWEALLKEWVIRLRNKCLDAFYRLRRRLSPEARNLPELLAALNRVQPPDKQTNMVMKIARVNDALAVDGYFDILHSYRFKGWKQENIAIVWHDAIALPDDLQRIADGHRPAPPNNGKYRLCGLEPDSSEDLIMRATLAPTDYFSTRPIQESGRLFVPLVLCSGGHPCSPMQKYGAELLDFAKCQLPNIVCVHVVVILDSGNLLVTQRVSKKGMGGVDTQHGTWSFSFEEQMSSTARVRAPDKTFFDAVRGGFKEELYDPDRTEGEQQKHRKKRGKTYECKDDDIVILSIGMDTESLNIDPIGLLRVPLTVDEVRAHCKWKSKDGRRELAVVEEVDWTVEALAPVLCGRAIEIAGTKVGPDEWHHTARMRALQSLFHKDGIEETLEALNRWARKNPPNQSELPLIGSGHYQEL
ncbi:hypothetical protein SBA6_740023 [Candidatus Sulfopaludibacter sp. SbA6]|nr:hypothetical protein SBA6_740023 [Candidatus Sulfopaludibacter sp. SbA6]